MNDYLLPGNKLRFQTKILIWLCLAENPSLLFFFFQLPWRPPDFLFLLPVLTSSSLQQLRCSLTQTYEPIEIQQVFQLLIQISLTYHYNDWWLPSCNRGSHIGSHQTLLQYSHLSNTKHMKRTQPTTCALQIQYHHNPKGMHLHFFCWHQRSMALYFEFNWIWELVETLFITET